MIERIMAICAGVCILLGGPLAQAAPESFPAGVSRGRSGPYAGESRTRGKRLNAGPAILRNMKEVTVSGRVRFREHVRGAGILNPNEIDCRLALGDIPGQLRLTLVLDRKPVILDSEAILNDGNWHQVAAVYDGKMICLYVDGDLDSSKFASGKISLPSQKRASLPIYSGQVTAVCVENRAWTSQEVLEQQFIAVTNFRKGERRVEIQSPLLRGILNDKSETKVTLTNLSSQRNTRVMEGFASNGAFCVIANLVRGENRLVIRAGEQSVSLVLWYEPSKSRFVTRLLVLAGKEGCLTRSADSPYASNVAGFRARASVLMSLLQSYVADQMYRAGFGHRSFALEFDRNDGYLPRIVSCEKSHADYARMFSAGADVDSFVKNELWSLRPRLPDFYPVTLGLTAPMQCSLGEYPFSVGDTALIWGSKPELSMPTNIVDVVRWVNDPAKREALEVPAEIYNEWEEAMGVWPRNEGAGDRRPKWNIAAMFCGESPAVPNISRSILSLASGHPWIAMPENPDNRDPYPAVNGVCYWQYNGPWESIPDSPAKVAAMDAVKNGTINDFGLKALKLSNRPCAIRIIGYLKIATEGCYSFFVSTDGEADLEIAGENLVHKAPGTDGESGDSILLKPGLYRVVVTCIHSSPIAKPEMTVLFKGPGYAKQPIPPALLFRSPDDAEISADLYVAPERVGRGNGKDWKNAMSLGDALREAARWPDLSLFLKRGRYSIGETAVIGRNVQLYGGFAGTERTLAERKQGFWREGQTVVEGKSQQDMFLVHANVLMDGLVLENAGRAIVLPEGIGGAVYLNRCIVEKNARGIHLSRGMSADPATSGRIGRLSNSVFRKNETGIFSSGSAYQAVNCVFDGNQKAIQTKNDAAGVAHMVHCTFVNNGEIGTGSVINLFSNCLFENCTMVRAAYLNCLLDNCTSRDDAGIYVNNGVDMSFVTGRHGEPPDSGWNAVYPAGFMAYVKGLTGHAEMVDSGGGYYGLLSESEAIGKGMSQKIANEMKLDISVPFTDMYGNERNRWAPSLGALEPAKSIDISQ